MKRSTRVVIPVLILAGGLIRVGLSAFECSASASTCGGAASCEWIVNVSEANAAEIDLQLSAPMVPSSLERCIEFEFFSDCVGQPEVLRRKITFGYPYGFPGHAHGIDFKVPSANYRCVTARDPLHTLRSTAEMVVDGDVWIARLLGDPLAGGNWLVGGNLNGDRVIDIRDVAILWSQVGASISPHTGCDHPGPHADLNGDGIVDSIDFDVVMKHWLMIDAETCCPRSDYDAERAAPLTEISIKELRQLGKGFLSVADTNHDGVVNLDDFVDPGLAPAKQVTYKRR